jgi:YD repeat-containing protein
VAAKFNPAEAGDSNAASFASTTGETWTLSSSALDSPSLTENQADTFAYDAAGHLVYHVDGHGEVTRTEYDAAGDVTRTTGYATLVGISSLGVTPTLASVQAQVTVRPTLDHVEQRILDAAGRLLFGLDAAGFVTQRSYDGNGNLTQEVRYANALQGSFTPGVAPQIVASAQAGGAYVIADPAHDRASRFVYDAANRPVFVIDAAGFVTQRFYNAKSDLSRKCNTRTPCKAARAARRRKSSRRAATASPHVRYRRSHALQRRPEGLRHRAALRRLRPGDSAHRLRGRGHRPGRRDRGEPRGSVPLDPVDRGAHGNPLRQCRARSR